MWLNFVKEIIDSYIVVLVFVIVSTVRR